MKPVNEFLNFKYFSKLTLIATIILGILILSAFHLDAFVPHSSNNNSLPNWVVENPVSNIFVLNSIPPTTGSLAVGDSTVPNEWLDDPAIDTLLLMMQTKNIYLNKTALHPYGIVSSDNIVIIKGNFQWTNRNTTSTDRIKGLIWRILNHPDGFSGEIIVCDNTQGYGINDEDNNSEDPEQSIIDVVNTFKLKGYPVFLRDWSYIWDVVVEEYSSGDYNDGFVYESDSKISYPKFTSPSGNYKISLKYGIWNSNSLNYNLNRLCIIDFPVLKAHSWSGATIALKNWIGVLTTAYADERYGGSNSMHYNYFFGSYALVAKVMGATFPKLTIVDAAWTSASSNSTLNDTIHTKMLLSSTDPCAASWYAAKYILTPVAIDPYNTNPDLPGSNYKNNLESWTNCLKDSGFACTKDSSEISVYDRSSLSLQNSIVNVNTGWNIISVPLLSSNMTGTSLFPTAISPFYSYNNGYVQIISLENGNGYWAKFNSSQNITITGNNINSNQLSINQGWNLLGIYDYEVSVSNINTIPSDIIISPFYGYNLGYQVADTLKPGKGYWVKTSVAGTMQFNTEIK